MKLKIILITGLIAVALVYMFGGKALIGGAPGMAPAAILPAPVSLVQQEGAFSLSRAASVVVPAGDAVLKNVATLFSDKVYATTGLRLALIEGEDAKAGVRFEASPDMLATDGYTLEVDDSGAVVRASSSSGFYYGAMSLWQLAQAHGSKIYMPFVSIEDQPRFPWRGAMLDVCRHFRDVDYVKRFIDTLAAHKLNVFHWHLTDDQGWRIEIKKYPRLTEVGAWRVPAGDAPHADIDPATGQPRLYGGFYTQDQVRDVVAYAAARNVTILPEIDIPGHASAAVAAYPEIGTEPVDHVSSDWGIYYSTFNLEDSTMRLLEDVMDEVLALFPGQFVHIGGDEVSTKQWENSPRIRERMAELGIEDIHEIQAYFTRHFANYLAERGRRLIGWDEILEGGSIADSAIMSWRGTKGGIEAAKAGRQVVMAPSPIYYSDYRQSYLPDEPPGREHVQTLEDVYSFEPVSAELSADEAAAIMGAEITVFTEHMRTAARVDYMAFPRLVALAETVWSPPAAKNYSDFTHRLMPHMARLKALGIKPADSAFAVAFEVTNVGGGEATVALSTQTGAGDIRYTLDGSAPDARSSLYKQPLTLDLGTNIKAASFFGAQALSHGREQMLSHRAFLRREEDELTLCSADLAIKLDDDWPIDGERANFLVDIIKPCWIYQAPDMKGVIGLEIGVGNLPYNFQIGDMINTVDLKTPQTDVGEIVVYRDSCDGGAELARLPLAPAVRSYGVTVLKADLPPAPDAKALCFHVAAAHYDPIWAIDHVQLVTE